MGIIENRGTPSHPPSLDGMFPNKTNHFFGGIPIYGGIPTWNHPIPIENPSPASQNLAEALCGSRGQALLGATSLAV